MWKYEEIAVRTLASGDSLHIPVFRIEGRGKGPNVYIQASMHGAELQGNLVILELLKFFEKNKPNGSITLVPLANPYGTNLKSGEFTQGRFDSTTGENWNRLYWQATCKDESARRDSEQIAVAEFVQSQKKNPWKKIQAEFRKLCLQGLAKKLKAPQSYGNGLAYRLQSMAMEADLVLDLHCASVSPRYVYSPQYALSAAKEFLFPFYLSVPNEFGGALDEATFCPWWDLAEALEKAGSKFTQPEFQSYTLELGNHETLDAAGARTDANCILRYLESQQVVADAPDVKLRQPQLYCDLADYKIIYAPAGGLAIYEDIVGKPVKDNAQLARIMNLRNAKKNTANVYTDVKAPAAGIPIVQFSSAAVHEGMELYRIMTNTKKL